MKIFDKRPLCMILCILLGGFVFFSDSELYIKLTVTIISVAFTATVLFLKHLSKNLKIVSVISSVTLLISYLLSFLYFDCYFNVYKLYTDEVVVVAKVIDANESTSGASLYLECQSINGNKSNQKLYSYVDNDLKSFVEVNTRVRIEGRLSDFVDESDYQRRTYMRSMGFSAELTDVKNYMIVDKLPESFDFKMSEYRLAICEKIIESAGSVGGGLLAALLLGERTFLPHQTSLSFRRTGLSHMLALSGLHLTIITFAISFALSLLKVKKKPRKVVEIIFVILYSLLTGMPVSVVRAALMHIIASLIFLLGAKMDSITSLAISVVIITFFTPYAIYDVALWLSAFATLGVLIYSELDETRKTGDVGFIKRIGTTLLSGVVISIFAISTTYLITCLSFGAVSLVGAFSTPLVSLLITPFMYLGLIYIVCLFCQPIGKLIDIFGSFIIKTVNALSSINGIYVLAEDFITTFIIITFTVLLVLFLIFDIKKKKTALIVLVSIFVGINASAATASMLNINNDDILYFCDEYDEYFVIKSEGKSAVIDVSSGTVSDAYLASTHIKDAALSEIDNYIYTNYSSTLADSVLSITESLYVKNIYLPFPTTKDEESVYNYLKNELEGGLTSISIYSTSDVLSIGNCNAIFSFRSTKYSICSFFIIDETKYVTCYTSSGTLDGEAKILASEMVSNCDRLILGRHGKNYSDFKFMIEYKNLKEIIVSSNNLTIPNVALEFYKKCNIQSNITKISLKR